MPDISNRVMEIVPAGKNGWEVHFTAYGRRRAGEDILMVTVGDHDFPTPAETVDACVEAVRAGYHNYSELSGKQALRQAMAAVSTEMTCTPTTAAEVLATVGGQGALFAAIFASCNPGDHAIVAGPYYATYPGTFRAVGVDYTVVDATADSGFQPNAALLETAVTDKTRAILINSPNNPTGAVYSRKTLEGLADLCRRHDLWLISDEVYWTHTDGRPHLSPRALEGMAERTLVVNSLSKSHGMTGWRVGWLTGPGPLIAHLNGLNLVTNYGLNDFVSEAAIKALTHRYGVDEIAKIYAQRRRAFLDALGNAPSLTVRGSEGGMYMMLDIRDVSADGEAFAWELLEAEKLAVMPGESFGEAAAGHLRISLGQPEDVLADAAHRLKRFVAAKLEMADA